MSTPPTMLVPPSQELGFWLAVLFADPELDSLFLWRTTVRTHQVVLSGLVSAYLPKEKNDILARLFLEYRQSLMDILVNTRGLSGTQTKEAPRLYWNGMVFLTTHDDEGPTTLFLWKPLSRRRRKLINHAHAPVSAGG